MLIFFGQIRTNPNAVPVVNVPSLTQQQQQQQGTRSPSASRKHEDRVSRERYRLERVGKRAG